MKNRFLQFLGLCKKAGKLIEGYNKCEEIIKSKNAKLIIISKDVSINTKDKFETYCKKYNVDFISAYSKEELGAALGRSEINLLCIIDERMSIKLIDLWNEENKI